MQMWDPLLRTLVIMSSGFHRVCLSHSVMFKNVNSLWRSTTDFQGSRDILRWLVVTSHSPHNLSCLFHSTLSFTFYPLLTKRYSIPILYDHHVVDLFKNVCLFSPCWHIWTKLLHVSKKFRVLKLFLKADLK